MSQMVRRRCPFCERFDMVVPVASWPTLAAAIELSFSQHLDLHVRELVEEVGLS